MAARTSLLRFLVDCYRQLGRVSRKDSKLCSAIHELKQLVSSMASKEDGLDRRVKSKDGAFLFDSYDHLVIW